MKKYYTSVFVLLFFSTISFAQLPTNEVAPDWTLTDINGVEHTLYDYLDEGKVVFFKFSATWCGPCWNYHQSGAFSQMWDEYGPDGTDEAMVFFIEGDPNTNTDCLYNLPTCNASTQGNWVDGTPYPIIDLPDLTVRNAYQVNAFPTVFSVCPDTRIVRSWGAQPPKSTLETVFGSCGLAAEVTETVDELCFGAETGMISIETEEGHGNKTYLWSNGATTQNAENLGQGIYSVIITDQNGREIYLEDIEISGPATVVDLSIDEVVNISCAFDGDGSISVSAFGGVPGYSYLWSTGETTTTISNLDGGNYFVTVTDENNCEFISQAIEVHEPLELEVILSVVNEECEQENGALIINVIGGTPNYLIDAGWGPSEVEFYESLQAGVYDVHVIDINECEAESSIEIDNIPAPTAVIEGDDFLFPCNEPEIMLDASESFGPGNIEFSWSTSDGNFVEGENTATPTIDAPGTYSLTVIDPWTGCEDFAEIVVDENTDLPVASIAPAPLVDCDNPELTLDGSASSEGEEYSYSWSTVNGNILEGEETLTPTINAPGVYILEVTNNENGCISTSSIEIEGDGDFPEIEVSSDGSISCLNQEVLLSGSGSAEGDNIIYSWENAEGDIISEDLEVSITTGGQFIFSVINQDNGCVSTEIVDVSELTDLPEATADVEGTLTCILNTIEIDGSGSSEGDEFVYHWTTEDGEIDRGDSTLFPLVSSAGSYTLTVVNTLSGCVNEVTVEVEEIRDDPEAQFEIDSDDLSLSFINSSENGQSFIWDFGDGNTSNEEAPEYTFETHGEYEICLTVTNDCGEDVICNTVFVAFSAVSTSPQIRHVSCFEGNDGAIQLEVSGNAPFEFDWSNGADDQNLSELEAGEYTVIITDDIGLTSELSFEINQPDLIELNEVEVVDVIAGEPGSISVEVVGGVEPYSYLWSNGAEEANISNLSMGEYTLTVTDANECEAIFGPFEVDEVSSVNNLNGVVNLNVYPNPFNDNLSIEIELDSRSDVNLVVRNILGQIVFERSHMDQQIRELIYTGDWPSGVYILEIMKSGERAEFRLVK